MAQRRRGLGAGAAIGVVVALGLLAWMFAGGEPQQKDKDGRIASSEHRGGKSKAKHAKKKKKGKGKKDDGERTKLAGPFGSKDACMASLANRKARPAGAPLRIGTWNIRWFPRGAVPGGDNPKPTDVEWLACAIATLEVDVLAVQEIMQDDDGKAALTKLEKNLDEMTGGKWSADTDDCAGSGKQHVGFLFDASRVQVSDLKEIGGLNPAGDACAANLRPGFGARVKAAGLPELNLVSVHFDSGQESRDYEHRATSLESLRAAAALAKPKQGVIVLGDFNTMGCAECMPQVAPEAELAKLDEEAAKAGLARLTSADGKVCSHYVAGKASLLDHVLVSSKPANLTAQAKLEMSGPCAALKCKGHRRGVGRPEAFDKLSDHCPLVMELSTAAQAAAAARAAAAAGGADAPAPAAPGAATAKGGSAPAAKPAPVPATKPAPSAAAKSAAPAP